MWAGASGNYALAMASEPIQPSAPDGDSQPGRTRLAPAVFVQDEALTFRAVRSSGPGGQNVNKRSTKIELRVALEAIPLDRGARSRLRRLAGSRLTDAGEIVIAADEERSQRRNREAALGRLREMVARALVRPKPRKKTKPSRGSVERRLKEKKQRGEIKRTRRRPG